MTKKTKTESMIDGMEACGWKLEPNAVTRKYRVFWREDKEFLLFVGKSGALRKGKIVSKSISIAERTKRAYRDVGFHRSCYTEIKQAQLHFIELCRKK